MTDLPSSEVNPPRTRLLVTASALLLLALTAALLTLGWRGSFARYVTDDFCSAATLHELGYGPAQWHHRQSWSGRFSYFAVKGLLESVGPVTPRFVPGALLLLFTAALAWTFRGWTGPGSRIVSLTAAAALVLATFDSSPHLWGAYLWETGSITYTLPLVIFAIWPHLFACERGLVLCCVFGGLLMLFAGGLSETTLAAQAALAGGPLLRALARRERRAGWIAAAGVAATVVALAIVATAPGNAVRARSLSPRPSLSEATTDALALANQFIGSHTFGYPAAMLLAIGAGALLATASPRIRPAPAAAAFAIAMAAYVLSFLPSAWALGAAPPLRALHVSQFFVLAALASAASAAASLLRTWRGWLPALAILLLACSALTIHAARERMLDIPAARRDAADLDALHATLTSMRGRNVTLRSAWALDSGVLRPSRDHWINRCVSRYYGLEGVGVGRRAEFRTQNAERRAMNEEWGRLRSSGLYFSIHRSAFCVLRSSH